MLNSANQAWTMYPGLSHGAYECLHAHGTRRAEEAPYLPKLVQRRVDRHHVPDRAALRHRPRPAAHQGRAAARRQLQAHRQQDLHLRRRARHGREHRPPGAGAPAGRAGGQQGHLAVRGAEVHASTADGTLGERNADLLRAASSTRWASTATPPARSCLDGAIGTLVGQPQQGPGGDVRDDERARAWAWATSRWA